MASLSRLFVEANFRQMIQRWCSQQGWNITEMNEDQAILQLRVPAGRTQRVFIRKEDNSLEFFVPSAFQFTSIDAVPHYISSLLLKRNSEKNIGLWSIEKIDNQQSYAYRYRVELEDIDSSHFASVVRALIDECDELEEGILKMMKL